MIFRIIMKILKLFLLIYLPASLIILIIWTMEHEPIEDVYRCYLCIGAVIYVLHKWVDVFFIDD